MSLIGQIISGLDHGIITMKKGEIALFTLTAELGNGFGGRGGVVVPPNSVLQFEVELISWIAVVDVSRDGGIIKKIIEKGKIDSPPSNLDEVLGTLITYYVIILFLFVYHIPFLKADVFKALLFDANGFINAVKYRVALDDGSIVAETPEEGTEFYVKDGILLVDKYVSAFLSIPVGNVVIYLLCHLW